MKRTILSAVLAVAAIAMLSGCTFYNGLQPIPAGWAYSNVSAPTMRLHAPIDAATAEKSSQVSAQGILGLVAMGDVSLQTAMKKAGMTKIHHVDTHYDYYIGGLYWKLTLTVYGE